MLHGAAAHQRRLLGAGAVRVVVGAEVEQAALVGVRRLRVGPVEGEADAGQQLDALGMQRVEGAGLDQRLDDALVDAAAVDAGAEVEQAGERRRRSSRAATIASIAPCPVPLIAPRP